MNLRSLSLCSSLFLSCALCAQAPKYVFLIIGDGMSTPQRMVADEYARACGLPTLAMNRLPQQCTTRTRSANQLVTDSAAAATAIACGEKADNGALGLAPDGRRLQSVAEFAKAKGMRVGVMTTVTIVHATPAGFYAHRKSRGESYHIALDLVASGFDYFAGGGVYDKYDDRTSPEWRGNVFDLARQAGYAVVSNKADLAACRPGGKVWGVFANDALAFAIDGDPQQPSLAEMVAKGIELLDNPNGFFLMAEGGKVDYAGHANDAGTSVREMLATDAAVKVALEFLERHPQETLVITTGDHETGGLTMGFGGLGYKFYVNLLQYQTCSAEKFATEFKSRVKKNPSIAFEEIMPFVTESFGLAFTSAPDDTPDRKLMTLKAPEIADLRAAFSNDVAFVHAKKTETQAYDKTRKMKFAALCKRLIANHAGLDWTTGAHTALPTMTTAQGCGAERFFGFMENTDIALRLKDLLK